MPKQIIIAEQHQIAAVFSEDQIQELVVSTGTQQVSDIYLGTVENVLPGIDAAFVNIGDSDRNGFMHVTDLGPLRLRRSASAITELLSPQQKVLVQVMKEPTGNKGPRLTGNISMPGRYLVLMPYGRGVNLSRRIESEAERSRLRALAVLIKPAGMGLLVRTEAESKGEDEILEDLDYLLKQWESVQTQASSARPPMLLNRDDDFIQRVLRDIYTADVNRIVVDSAAAVKRVKQHLRNWSGGRAPEGVLIDHHRDRLPILEFFRVNAAIREALKPRVDLPSGGYIIIEPTEALTVIDVNSGSFTRSATSRETVLWTNYEAATEIARQMRLRNLAGVLVVDFIDMDSRRDQLALLEHFTKALAADKARPQIAQLSELGLVELTRKRQGQNLYELFGKECPHCGGLGHLARLPGEADHTPLERAPLSIPSTPTTVSKTPRILDKREEEEETLFDGESEHEKSLDLVNHPSYQDSGNTGNRRRRRRRIGEGESVTNGSASSIPSRTKPRLNANRNGEPEKETFEAESSAVATESAERQERPERQERDRTAPGRVSRREYTPPEKVTVPMTPLEQEIYALMGVSPLIRIERDVKDPKSVLVSVADVDSSAAAQEFQETVTELPDVPVTAATTPPAQETVDREGIPAPVKQEPEPSTEEGEAEESTQVVITSAASSKPKKKNSEAVAPESEASSTPRTSPGGGTRRRRRRSSARSGS
ncbi:Rne/Rng family ribonuclease [Spirulina major CS-329]|uniref:Rne/Rng family ribonuclease n=1 Tax=Spirulina TaxID=1154 RepID=UPI00232E9BF8|nr:MULTISPECIES: Rne/Rng family ribonuclease [Spirulina]MDB9493118.1 Rne/Rng family ribonuclease [Spirulina subsalsa CS-330]MDB9504202.1 Rne/Rng family ribonuclease [Spirulina major CS-329]